MRLCRWIDLRKGGIDWSGYQRQPHKLHDVGSNPTPATNSDVTQVEEWWIPKPTEIVSEDLNDGQVYHGMTAINPFKTSCR